MVSSTGKISKQPIVDAETSLVLMNSKSKKKQVYVSGSYYSSYIAWLPYDWDQCKTIGEADLLLLAGGQDINPALYNQKAHKPYFTPARDEMESSDYIYARSHNIPVFGTCRGMQMITALEGGSLIFDIHHSGGHQVNNIDGTMVRVNSLHHQMCNPFTMPFKNSFEILQWRKKGSSPWYHDGFGKDVKLPENFKEPEMIWFPKADALGVQWHPEMMVSSDATRYLLKIFDLFMNKQLGNYVAEWKKVKKELPNETKIIV